MMFAESTAQLGYDPTVKRHPTLNRYDIEVHAKDGVEKYRTRSSLSLVQADELLGRCTRIYKAVRLGKNGKPIPRKFYSIKDTWIEDDRDREGEIYRTILREAESMPVRHKALKELLLNVVADGDVMVNDEKLLTRDPQTYAVYPDSDDTRRFGETKPYFLNLAEGDVPRAEKRRLLTRTKIATSISAPPDHLVHRQQPKLYHRMVRYRMVSSDVGKALHTETDLSKAYSVIGRLVRGMSFTTTGLPVLNVPT